MDQPLSVNSMQLVAGRTGQEYNQRKNRKGAYWEDRRYFVETVEEFLGIRGKGRDVVEVGQGYQLRERAGDYKPLFGD